MIGVVANVLGNGSPIMTSFAAAIGLDAPLEASTTAPLGCTKCPASRHIECQKHVCFVAAAAAVPMCTACVVNCL